MAEVSQVRARELGITLDEQVFPMGKARVSFPLFHSLRGRVLWAPLRFTSAAYYYGSERQWVELMRNLCRPPNREGTYFELNLYSFRESPALPRRRYLKTYHMRRGLEELLDELLLVRGELRRRKKESGKLDLNRRVSLLVLDLGERELVELQAAKVVEKLRALVENSDGERLYFFLLSRYARAVPPEVRRLFEWSAWLGEDNWTLLRQVEVARPLGTYNVNRELVGGVVEPAVKEVTPVHNLVFEPSTHRLKTEEVASAEEEAFEALLNSLEGR